MAELETMEEELIQYIVVRIGSEQYGIDIRYIDNIVRMQRITRVPTAQSYFKGIINLRGVVVPVMSIRKKMGLDDDVITNKSRIIIMKIDQQGLLGIVVDEVREVVTLGESQIDKTSYDAKGGKNTFINGIGKNGEELISLFDIGAIVDQKENA